MDLEQFRPANLFVVAVSSHPDPVSLPVSLPASHRRQGTIDRPDPFQSVFLRKRLQISDRTAAPAQGAIHEDTSAFGYPDRSGLGDHGTCDGTANAGKDQANPDSPTE
jgi:hypothetical protein